MTLMGGARHPADEARVEGLKVLARELGVEVSHSTLNLGWICIGSVWKDEIEADMCLLDGHSPMSTFL